MEELNLDNIVSFKAVDVDGNEQNVTVDDMVSMVASRMASAVSEASPMSAEMSTYAATAATGNDVYENELPIVSDYATVRVVTSDGTPAQATKQTEAKVVEGLLGNPKGTVLFSSWEELTEFVNTIDNYSIQPFASRFMAFDGEGFYGNIVQGWIIKSSLDNVFIFGVAIDGTLIFRKRNYPDTSTWENPKVIVRPS